MSDNHKYRVTVYLGKELHDQLQTMADFLGLPLATATKLILKTGYEMSKALDSQATRAINARKEENKEDGNEQSKK